METGYRQLVLCPVEQHWVPASRVHWRDRLREFGVLGAGLNGTADRYLIGDAFLQLFSFMGCAPSIEFAPAAANDVDWHSFVFVQLSPTLDQPRWLADHELAKPGCPACHRRMRNWSASYQTDTATLQCVHCQQQDSVCNWRWYDGGGCARQFISIVNVYPKESLPTDTLMSYLQAESGCSWQYFYLNAPLIEK